MAAAGAGTKGRTKVRIMLVVRMVSGSCVGSFRTQLLAVFLIAAWDAVQEQDVHRKQNGQKFHGCKGRKKIIENLIPLYYSLYFLFLSNFITQTETGI